MDTTLAVMKRIEQQLTHLRRELERDGFEMPEQAFYVHTGKEISVQVAENAPEPKAVVQPTKAQSAPVVETIERVQKRGKKPADIVPGQFVTVTSEDLEAGRVSIVDETTAESDSDKPTEG